MFRLRSRCFATTFANMFPKKYPTPYIVPVSENNADFWMKHRQYRYRHLLNNCQLEYADKFIAHGKEYGPLPWQCDCIPEALSADGISPEKVRYLSTLFALEGSIACIRHARGTWVESRMTLGSAFDNAELPLELAKVFGGKVQVVDIESGNGKPHVAWYGRGDALRNAVSILQSEVSPKQHLLQQLWRILDADSAAEKRRLSQEFRVLPKHMDVGQFITTPEQVAALFDAAGSVRTVAPNILAPEMWVTDPQIMEDVQAVLENHGIASSKSYRCFDSSKTPFRNRLVVSSNVSKRAFYELIAPFVFKKRAAVLWLLDNIPAGPVTSLDSRKLREAYFQHRGGFSQFIRIADDTHMDMSEAILRISKKRSRGTATEQDIENLKVLQAQRLSYVAKCKTNFLRSRIRDVLARGAVIRFPGSPRKRRNNAQIQAK